MSLSSGRGSALGPIAPTFYIQTTITGEGATRPVTHQPMLNGLVGSYSGGFILPGGPCGLSSSNAYIPCGGGSFCSDVQLGVCTRENAIGDPNVNLQYVNYGSRY